MAAAGYRVQYQQSCGTVDKKGSLDLLLVGEQTFCTLCRTQIKPTATQSEPKTPEPAPEPKACNVLVLFKRDTRRTQMVDSRRLDLGAREAAVVKAMIVGHCTSSSRRVSGG